jgi:hypothetical protein
MDTWHYFKQPETHPLGASPLFISIGRRFSQCGENAMMLFRFDQQDAAIDVLLKNGITVLPGEKLYSF